MTVIAKLEAISRPANESGAKLPEGKWPQDAQKLLAAAQGPVIDTPTMETLFRAVRALGPENRQEITVAGFGPVVISREYGNPSDPSAITKYTVGGIGSRLISISPREDGQGTVTGVASPAELNRFAAFVKALGETSSQSSNPFTSFP